MMKRFQLPVAHIPLMPMEIKGLDMLIALGEQIYDRDLRVETGSSN
jgi:hypothetical protein